MVTLIKEGGELIKKKTLSLQTWLPTAVTLVCSVVFSRVGTEPSPMATLPVFIIGLLPLSCHHSEHCFPQGIVFWDATELRWLELLSSVAHAASVSCCMHCTPIQLVCCRFTHKSPSLTFKVSARSVSR